MGTSRPRHSTLEVAFCFLKFHIHTTCLSFLPGPSSLPRSTSPPPDTMKPALTTFLPFLAIPLAHRKDRCGLLQLIPRLLHPVLSAVEPSASALRHPCAPLPGLLAIPLTRQTTMQGLASSLVSSRLVVSSLCRWPAAVLFLPVIVPSGIARINQPSVSLTAVMTRTRVISRRCSGLDGRLLTASGDK